MSIYDLRFCVTYNVTPQGGGCNHYTDSVLDVLSCIRRGGVAWITDGYGEADYSFRHPGGIDGVMTTRRTTASYSPEEFAAEFADAASLEQAIRYWADYGVSREDVIKAEAHRLAMREEAPTFAAALDRLERAGLAVKAGKDELGYAVKPVATKEMP